MFLISSGCNLLLLLVCDRKVNSGTFATVRLLLEVGADSNAKDKRVRFSSWHTGWERKRAICQQTTTNLLLENGATWIIAINFVKLLWISGKRSIRKQEEAFYRRPRNSLLSLVCWSARYIQRYYMVPYDDPRASCTKAFVNT